MGSYYEHLLWAAVSLAVIQSLILAVVLKAFFLTLGFITIFYLVGTIMPDVDLPKRRWFPTLILSIIIPIGGYYLSRDAHHWGHFHSIIGGLFISIFLALWVFLLSFSLDVTLLLSSAFFIGYLFHITSDQVYHHYKQKSWPRRALKLW